MDAAAWRDARRSSEDRYPVGGVMAPITTRSKVLVALLCAFLLVYGLFLLTGGVLGVYHHEWPDDAMMSALGVSYPNDTDDTRFLGVSLRFSYCLIYFVFGGVLLIYSVHIPFRIERYKRDYQQHIATLRRLFKRGG
jgi:TRAP-type C4-dicarboxylate transport system permease small subunit